MQQTLSEIRTAAKRDLLGKWWKAILLFLFFSLFCFTFNLLILQNGDIGWITMVAFSLFIGLPLGWGYLVSFLTNSREIESPFAFSHLLVGFKDYLRITITLCIRELYILFWMLVLLVPYIILITFIMGGIGFEEIGVLIDGYLNDNFYMALGWIDESCGDFADYILGICFSIPFIIMLLPGLILSIIKSLSYSMTPYILYDYKDLKYNGAIELSMKMMDGHKKQLLCLYLSFIGWGVVCLMTLCIGFLWLNPYINASLTRFYEQMKDEYEQKR